jgi:hypothetical protein
MKIQLEKLKNIQPAQLQAVECDIFRTHLMGYAYEYVFKTSDGTPFEEKISRVLALQEKIDSGFKEDA